MTKHYGKTGTFTSNGYTPNTGRVTWTENSYTGFKVAMFLLVIAVIGLAYTFTVIL
jgi:hypothetical protein